MKNEKFIFAQVKDFNDKGELVAVASTYSLDRQCEAIEPEAWKKSLPTYRTNPVILATHLHRLSTGDSPVIGSAKAIEITKDGLIFSMTFAGTDLGKQYEQLYREKHMRAFSVGFIPGTGEWRNIAREVSPGVTKQDRVYVHTEVELLEISAVPVPANPEALSRMQELMAGAAEPDGLKLAIGNWQLTIENLQSAIKNLREEVINNLAAVRDGQAQVIEMLTLSPELMHDHAAPVVPGPADGSSHRGDGYDKGAERLAAAIHAALKPSNN